MTVKVAISYSTIAQGQDPAHRRTPYNAHAPLPCAQTAIAGAAAAAASRGEPERKARALIFRLDPLKGAAGKVTGTLNPPPGFGAKDIEEQIKKGDFDGAIKAATHQLRSTNDPNLYVLRARAECMLAGKRELSLKDAVKHLDAVIAMGHQVSPDVRQNAFIERGNINYRLQNFGSAADDFGVVVRDFKNTKLVTSLIKACFHAGRYQEASEINKDRPVSSEVKLYRRASKALLAPRDRSFELLTGEESPSHKKLSHALNAFILLRKGRTEEAAKQLAQFKEINQILGRTDVKDLIKDYPPVLFVESTLDVLQGKVEKIGHRYARLVALGSNIGEIYAQIANEVLTIIIEREKGNLGPIRECREIQNLISFLEQVKAPETFFSIADVYQRMGQPFKAINHCNEALKLDQNHLDSHRMLTEIHFELGNFEGALPHCEQVCREYELDSPFNIYLYAIYMALNNRDKIAEAHKEVASMSREAARALLTNFEYLFKYGDVGQMVALAPHFEHIQRAVELVKAQA